MRPSPKDAALALDGPSSSGGARGTGGAIATGGALATGGAPATGGAVATGGAIRTGGAVGTGGGIGTGGAVRTGGAVGTGGVANTGGAIGTGGTTIDGGTGSLLRDATKVQTVSLTANQAFMLPTAPFLIQADLTRGADSLFNLSAKVLVSVSACTPPACNQQVTIRLTREQTTRVESWLAVIPGEACKSDPGPVCDFSVLYAVGIDGPPQNQTCCKLNRWGQNADVEALHAYLQTLAVAELGIPDAGTPADVPSTLDTSIETLANAEAGPTG